MLKPGDQAPNSDLPCASEGKLGRINLTTFHTEMVVLFFYPRDFSFICPTEVAGFHKQRRAFAEAGAAIIGLSVDNAESHRRWAEELGGVGYPLAADTDAAVARLYGVFDENERTAMRATFILDHMRTISYAVASRVNVGRSVGETLRVVQALGSGHLCPADWQPGDGFGPDRLKY